MFKRMLLALVPAMTFPALVYSAPIVYGARVDLSLASYSGAGTAGASAVVVADFDGDGRDDLAAMALDRLVVFQQTEDGVLTRLELDVPYPAMLGTVHAADLGGDGTTELLVGRQNGMTVFKWNEASGFVPYEHPATFDCWNIATADLDGDGAPDVACLGKYADAMTYYSDPVTVLSTPVYWQIAATDAGSLGQAQLKDVTGDGKPDLIVASGKANSFFVYAHDGDRGFLPAVAYTYPEGAYLWSHTIEALDLDHDGSDEVVVAAPCNIPCAKVYVYRQGANGYLDLAQEVPTLDIPDALVAVDLDENGHADLLVGHRGWFTVGRYLGKGQGLPSVELWSSVPVQQLSRGLAVGDLNHDGFADLAVANSFGVSVLSGRRQVPSDFNSDLRSDLVLRNGTGENRLWPSADSSRSQSLPSHDPAWALQAQGDFDGDGMADLFWRNRITGANAIWEGGTSQTGSTAAVASQDWQVAAAGDFDGDGRADLFWRNSRSGANAIWKSGNSETQQATSGVTDQRWKVAGVGDFDGDGESDILWRHSTSGSNTIWRSGRSELPQAVAAAPDLQWKVAGVGDFNADGKDDMVWSNTGTGANTIWLSANSAMSKAVSSVSDLAWFVAAVGDYNGDGDADLMWRNGRTGANLIWRSADSRQPQAVTSMPGWNVIP